MNADDGSFDQFSVALRIGDRYIRFALDDAEDEIQRHIVKGGFYEIDQLRYHASLIPRSGRVLDIGANIGNHSIYYATVCKAELVISIEPNPRAARLFSQTIIWNEICNIELVADVAAGAGTGWAVFDHTEALHHNLGGTSLKEVGDTVEGGIPVRTGDSVVGGRAVDFIKIDVEGSELSVLTGLQDTINVQSPIVAAEIMPQSRNGFMEWCTKNGYRIERSFQMYRGIMNYVCLPMS